MNAIPFTAAWRLQGHAGPKPHKPDFAALVGSDGWRRLAGDIRRRFSEVPCEGHPIRYRGTMRIVACSRAGFVLAQLLRLLGTPFAPYAGSEIPVDIVLSRDPADGGIVWDRVYRYPGHAPVLVRSVKRIGPEGELRECVGAGFGMRLAVFEAGGALHFLSRRYFWQLGAWQVPLPAILAPGIAHVVHEDLGGGEFRFVMTICNRWLGTLFHQDGVFRREGAPT
jgi:hypothetical protein